MPNPNAVKYSTQSVPNTLSSGNFYLGVTDRDYGPTINTGYYAGINIDSGYVGYVWDGTRIVYNKSIDDSQVINFLSQKAGVSFSELTAALAWSLTQSDILVVNKNYENIVTDGLIFNLDAGFVPSYPGTGNTWYNLSGNNATLINGTSFSSVDGGMILDGINDGISYPSITLSNTYTLEFCGNMNGPIDLSNRRSIFNDGITYFGEFSSSSTYFTNITCDGTPIYFNFNFSGGITIGANFHWVFIVNENKTNDIYVNGNLRTTGTQLTTYSNISSTFRRFGISSGGSRPYFWFIIYC